MSGKKALGGNWYQYIQAKDGRPYYYNRSTKKTQWSWPDEIPKPAKDGTTGRENSTRTSSSSRTSTVDRESTGRSNGLKVSESRKSTSPNKASDAGPNAAAIAGLGQYVMKKNMVAPDAKQVSKLLKKARDGSKITSNVDQFRSMYNPLQKIKKAEGYDLSFIDFAQDNFVVSKGGLFSKKENIEDLVIWSDKGDLRHPLLIRTNESKCKNEAMQMMRNMYVFKIEFRFFFHRKFCI